MSIPIASPRVSVRAYSGRMAKSPVWADWGKRFRAGCRGKTTTRQVAEKLGLAESTVRSWINGTRELNLTDFFRLCGAAGLDPALILFASQDSGFIAIGNAWARTDKRGRELLTLAAETALRLVEGEGASGAGSSPPRS
jgi:transcriptional regulator with XRE-family HTH domain